MLPMKFLVVSMENFCVFTYSDSRNIANALTAGAGDAITIGITKATNDWFQNITHRDMFQKKIIQFGQNTMTELEGEPVSEAWREMQETLRQRQTAFHVWESSAQNQLAKIEQNVWDEFDQAAYQEIMQCDPAQGYYTWLIREYARTMELPLDQAYKNLKLRSESDRASKFRVQMLAEKWKDKINSVSSPQDIQVMIRDMRREFWMNSKI